MRIEVTVTARIVEDRFSLSGKAPATPESVVELTRSPVLMTSSEAAAVRHIEELVGKATEHVVAQAKALFNTS